MNTDLWSLYGLMLKSRLFEEIITRLWKDGLISGEMHLGTGEEAIMAGVVPQLQDGDSMALDHRGTAAMLLRGVDPVLLLREILGRPEGLCGGMGGHMHLFSKEHLAASSGIVGAAGPTAAGFGLAAQTLHPGAIAAAFFGEAAMNQGMLMESMNLASAWSLPVLFVCKDDQWAITTDSNMMTGGRLAERVRGLGLFTMEVDGRDVMAVWEAARTVITHIRSGKGPAFLHASCIHLEGHFLGYQLLRTIRDPLHEMPRAIIPMMGSFLHPGGAPLRERMAGLVMILSAILTTIRDPRQDKSNDPIFRARAKLAQNATRLLELETSIQGEIQALFSTALQEVPA